MGQLAMLKVRVRFGTAQKEVEKAFDAAARELQLPREEIEELSVPDCGLGERWPPRRGNRRPSRESRR